MTDTLSANAPAFDLVSLLAAELSLPPRGIAAVVTLLGEGNTVPFIARYRKEATGGLDEVQIRLIEERRSYLLELEERRTAILKSIAEQGKLDAPLAARLAACTSKAALEDLYLPYKPKRRTRAAIARERGLEPLAARILAQSSEGDPMALATEFINPEAGVEDAAAVLAGARDIVAETAAEKADIRAYVRRVFAEEGLLVAEAVAKKSAERTKFEQYYDFAEPLAKVPSHRYLAIRRGEREEVLRARVEVDVPAVVGTIEAMMQLDRRSPWASALADAIADGYKRLLAPSVESDVRTDAKLRADRAAVDVFADNLANLLLAAPLGTRSVIAIDPGLRTGCKCAAVDATGKFLGNLTIYLTKGEQALERARHELRGFIAEHRPAAIAVGNGTGGREAEAFVRELLAAEGVLDTFLVQVNEAGASVYSASDLAREEFPDLDLTVRGAISIARRLQDPLAELVKIEPKAIGVGQYQHDVHQPLLSKKLGDVVEDCVNAVGVELNTASAPLLSYVAGIGNSVAKKIVAHREQRGAFGSRQALLEVSGLGPKAFEQAAGFLRIRGGAHPLDSSAVHPERYALVESMARDLGVEVAELVGNAELVRRIELGAYVGDEVGEPTLRDILAELAKPGRDPRAAFEPPKFRADVSSLADLQVDMVLDGVVTNVTAFGAFVDVGVHQDGLVHVSQLADRFVKDPREVVKVGDPIKVRVLEVDLERKRISLSARSGAAPRVPQPQPRPAAEAEKPARSRPPRPKSRNSAPRQEARGAAEAREERGQGMGTRGFRNNPFADLANLKRK